MELIRVSDAKLKVMLSAEDMERYELSADEMDYENNEARQVFWRILDEAKNRTGFDAVGERLLIQMYPSRKGGCELFVTKLGAEPCEEKPLSASRFSVMSRRVSLYAFREEGSLLWACRALREAGYSGESRLYYAEDGRYYLQIHEKVRCSGPLKSVRTFGEYAFLEECGERQTGPLISAYIDEHAVCLKQGDAVQALGALA